MYSLKKYQVPIKKIIKPPEVEKENLFAIEEMTYQNEKDFLLKVLLIDIVIILLLLAI